MKFAISVIYLISTVTLSFGEFIQLENKTHITCIIDDDSSSSLYVVPPVVHAWKNSTIFLYDDKLWNDWTLKHSTEVVVPSVTDKRWEDFATIYTNLIQENNVKRYEFSVYGTSLNITTSDPILDKQSKTFEPRIWNHYNMYPKYKNSSIQIKAEAPSNAYWRIHDYQLRWAEHISTTPTSIEVPANENCLILYIYLCSYCKLEVDVLGRKYAFHGIDESLVWNWQSRRIELESATNISFIRSTFNGSIEEGQWGIDIRRCPLTIGNKTIYNVDIENDVEKDVVRICDVSKTVTGNNIFSCDPGLLGSQCDLSCEALLGSDAKYCENQKICSIGSFTCLCAWGFKGESCDQACSDGEWGLSCKRACTNCKRCKTVTGECTSSSQRVHTSLSIMFLLMILLVRF